MKKIKMVTLIIMLLAYIIVGVSADDDEGLFVFKGGKNIPELKQAEKIMFYIAGQIGEGKEEGTFYVDNIDNIKSEGEMERAIGSLCYAAGMPNINVTAERYKGFFKIHYLYGDIQRLDETVDEEAIKIVDDFLEPIIEKVKNYDDDYKKMEEYSKFINVNIIYKREAFEVMVDNKVSREMNCSSITALTDYFCHKIGLRSVKVIDYNRNHTWNALKINGEWTGIDTTNFMYAVWAPSGVAKFEKKILDTQRIYGVNKWSISGHGVDGELNGFRTTWESKTKQPRYVNVPIMFNSQDDIGISKKFKTNIITESKQVDLFIKGKLYDIQNKMMKLAEDKNYTDKAWETQYYELIDEYNKYGGDINKLLNDFGDKVAEIRMKKEEGKTTNMLEGIQGGESMEIKF